MTEARIVPGFPDDQRARAAWLYMQAFGGKIAPILGRDARAERFIARVMDPSHALSAIAPDGTLLGFAGFKTAQGALVGDGLADLAAIYGWFGALWRGPVLGLLERDLAPDQLLMDGIAVAPEARGQGLGTRLLTAILDEARARGLAAVRLDVIDTNPRARALYERTGFVAEGTERLGPLRHVFGFSSATRMVHRLGPD